MRSFPRLARMVGLCAFTLMCAAAFGATPRVQVRETLANLPIRFENSADRAAGAAFEARAGRMQVRIQPTSSTITVPGETVRVALVDANHKAALTGLDRLDGVSNYLIGRDSSKWRTHVPGFARVQARGVYPGVDVIYYGTGRDVEFDFVVHPHADPEQIKLRFEGGGKLRIDASGDLVLETGAGLLRHQKPGVWQQEGAKRKWLEGRYVLLADRRVGFRVSDHDRRKPLVIDPKLSYSTYFGGKYEDLVSDMAVDAKGNVYLTGATGSPDFPISGRAYDMTLGASAYPYGRAYGDAFVVKLGPDGKTLVYSTFVGGGSIDGAMAIAVDKNGAAAIVGGTSSTDFPIKGNAFQSTLKYYSDYFVAKLNADGSALIYATLIGGSSSSVQIELTFEGMGIAMDESGDNIYICGQSFNSDFPLTAGAAQTKFGGGGIVAPFDAFVALFNIAATSGSSLFYSTLLGGNGNDSALSIAVDKEGNAYVRGGTTSSNFPTTAGAFQTTRKGPADAFLTKISPDGKTFLYSTYLGGTDSEYWALTGASGGPFGELPAFMIPFGVVPMAFSSRFGGSAYGSGVAVDSSGYVYVSGATNSADFPITNGAFQTQFKGGSDGFVVKLDLKKTGASALVYSTLLGGSNFDRVQSILVDSSGRAYLRGETRSSDFPVTANSWQGNLGGEYDLFIALLDSNARNLVYSTYFGGAGDDQGVYGLGLDSFGNVYLAGSTNSTDLPTTTGAFQTTLKGTYNGFIAKLDMAAWIPRFTLAGIANAANYVAGKVSPGEIIVIFGKDFGPAALAGLLLTNGMVATETGETRVLFDGVAAPMVYAANGQVSCVVPYEVAGKTTTQVVVEYKKVKGAAVAVPVVAAVPGLFSINSSGTGPGAFLNENNSVNSAANPLERGKIAIFYGTGEGQTTPGGVSGLPATTVFPKPVLPVTVTIGGKSAEVLYYGAAPYMVAGVIQINARVPTDIAAGVVEVVIRVGKNASTGAVTLAVK